MVVIENFCRKKPHTYLQQQLSTFFCGYKSIAFGQIILLSWSQLCCAVIPKLFRPFKIYYVKLIQLSTKSQQHRFQRSVTWENEISYLRFWNIRRGDRLASRIQVFLALNIFYFFITHNGLNIGGGAIEICTMELVD